MWLFGAFPYLFFLILFLLFQPKEKKKDMDALKQELDIDDHKVPIAELYRRSNTNPDTVSYPPIT